MRSRFVPALFGLSLVWPLTANAKLITYDFVTVGTDARVFGELPLLPAEVFNASAWEVRGSIVVDDEAAPIYNEPRYIELGNGIVDASLTINGFSVGGFESGSFRYYFLDGFEDIQPYDAELSLNFAAGEHFGPAHWGLYTADFNWSGPDIHDIDLTSLTSILEAIDANTYEETSMWVGGPDSLWLLHQDLASEFVPRAVAVSEPESLLLLSLGLVGIAGLRRRSAKIRQ